MSLLSSFPFWAYQHVRFVCLWICGWRRKDMQSSPKSIFRPEAMRRYAERAADPVFQKSAMPRAFMLLWALLGLLGLLASLAFSSSVPIYARGVAAFALPDRQDPARKLVVILVPADQAARVQIGQRVLIRPEPLRDVETARINL